MTASSRGAARKLKIFFFLFWTLRGPSDPGCMDGSKKGYFYCRLPLFLETYSSLCCPAKISTVTHFCNYTPKYQSLGWLLELFSPHCSRESSAASSALLWCDRLSRPYAAFTTIPLVATSLEVTREPTPTSKSSTLKSETCLPADLYLTLVANTSSPRCRLSLSTAMSVLSLVVLVVLASSLARVWFILARTLLLLI